MNKIKVAPSILSADFSNLASEVKKLQASGADMLHIDVMDGHFVPNISIGLPVVRSLRKHSSLEFDVHLMISNPELYIEAFVDAGADIISFHIEATNHANKIVHSIKSFGKKACIAINPSTNPSVLDYLLDDLDMVLIMSVNPGFGGQKFIDKSIEKIKYFSGKIKNIQVDGGIDDKTSRFVKEAGANVLVSGSYLFESTNLSKAIQLLREE